MLPFITLTQVVFTKHSYDLDVEHLESRCRFRYHYETFDVFASQVTSIGTLKGSFIVALVSKKELQILSINERSKFCSIDSPFSLFRLMSLPSLVPLS